VSTLVIAETRDDGVTPSSIESIAAAALMSGPVAVVVPGASVDAACREIAAFDVASVTALEHPGLSPYTADAFVMALADFIPRAAPRWVVAPHSYRSRDFMPALAARLDRALVSDVTGATAGRDGLVLTRSMFRGKLTAEVVVEGPPPAFVTIQAGAVAADRAARGTRPAPIVKADAQVDPARIRQAPEPPFRETRQTVDLGRAERIVAVGRGIKSSDHLALARSLAEALGAEMAASRPICDAGWLPMDRQIGSSGQTVAPALYVAIGISGAIQHIVGMKGARTIVAVNKDPDAPIFEVADYGIVGDLFDVVPAIVAALKG
jgi:electron transfer flavoprotein alpha subunit